MSISEGNSRSDARKRPRSPGAFNETVCGLSIIAWPRGVNGEPDPAWKAGTDTITDIRPGQLRDRSFEDKQRKPDDMEAQEGQRRIAIHALENLVSSDIGVSLLRRTLRDAMRAVREGREPQKPHPRSRTESRARDQLLEYGDDA